MGLLLAASRRISELDRRLRIPGSVKVELLANLGHSLYGATLGIVGMGRIGRALARRAIAAGMKIVYHNRHRLDEVVEQEYKATYLPFDELLRTADVVSLNAPHNTDTYHLIDACALRMMKPTAILINTAGGRLSMSRLSPRLYVRGRYGQPVSMFSSTEIIPYPNSRSSTMW